MLYLALTVLSQFSIVKHVVKEFYCSTDWVEEESMYDV